MVYNCISMRKIDLQEFLGVPIPSPEEQDVLWQMAFDESDAYNSLADVADTALYIREEIGYVIEKDKRFFLDNEIPPKLTIIEADQALKGIELGYKFIVGAITYMHYLRRTSDDIDVHDFLYGLPQDTNVLPLALPSAQQRMYDCITGAAILQIPDGAPQPTPGYRSPIISEHACEYLEASPLLSVIIERQEDLIYNETYNDEAPGESAHADGFARGVEGGLTLYIESSLETLLDDARS